VPGDVSEIAFVLCCLAAAGGGVVQAVVGFGYAMLVVPTLLLIRVDLIPTAPLVVATPMVLWLAWADREGFDAAAFWRMTAGRLPGTVVGAWLLGILGTTALSVAAGTLLVAAAALSFARGPGRASPPVVVAAGFASGLAGTVGAVGGPYLGLAMADRPGPTLRATVSVAFAVGILLSLLALWAADRIEPEAVELGIALMPATGVGLVVGRRVAHRLRGGRLRPVVLGFAATGGLFAILRGLL
jgi:hypothetical protein